MLNSKFSILGFLFAIISIPIFFLFLLSQEFRFLFGYALTNQESVFCD